MAHLDPSEMKTYNVQYTEEVVEDIQDDQPREPPVEYEDGLQLGFETTQEDLPKSYFYSPRFLGTWVALGFFSGAGFGGFAMVAPVLSYIKADLGPDTGSLSNWLAIVYTVCLAVGGLAIGRLTDIFGRRHTFIVGSLFGVIGSIVCATAKDLRVCIGGQTLIGLGSAVAFSFIYAFTELLPVKYRFYGLGSLYVFNVGVAPLAPAEGASFVLHTEQSWRWCYWMLLIMNGTSFILLTAFYFPPTFKMKHGESKKWQYVKDFDYVGLSLYAAGLTLLILGLNWGGSTYPWRSAQVISTIVIGVVSLVALVVWESHAKLKEPLIPWHIVQNRSWLLNVICASIGATVYYSLAIVWPLMSQTVYNEGGPMTAGWIACASTASTTLGALTSGMLNRHCGKPKWQIMVALTIGATLIASCAASTPESRTGTTTRVFLGCFAIGWVELATQVLITILLKDVRDIGAATGLGTSIRSAISAVAQAIYVTVLTSRLTTTIPKVVVPAVVEAGLPITSVPEYFAAVATGSVAAIEKVPGITPTILSAGAYAYKLAYTEAFKTVCLVSIALSGVGVVCSFFLPSDTEKLMTDKVGVTLHKAMVGKHEDTVSA